MAVNSDILAWRDGRTHIRTDGRTDTASYRDAMDASEKKKKKKKKKKKNEEGEREEEKVMFKTHGDCKDKLR